MSAIVDIHAREIHRPRGNPTVEADVVLQAALSAALPFRPALLPAFTPRLLSCVTATKTVSAVKALRKAVENVNDKIYDALAGLEVEDQIEIDQTMIDLDGT